jgi:hypothetical protein
MESLQKLSLGSLLPMTCRAAPCIHGSSSDLIFLLCVLYAFARASVFYHVPHFLLQSEIQHLRARTVRIEPIPGSGIKLIRDDKSLIYRIPGPYQSIDFLSRQRRWSIAIADRADQIPPVEDFHQSISDRLAR